MAPSSSIEPLQLILRHRDERVQVAPRDGRPDDRGIDFTVVVTEDVAERAYRAPRDHRIAFREARIEEHRVPHGLRNAEQSKVDRVVHIGIARERLERLRPQACRHGCSVRHYVAQASHEFTHATLFATNRAGINGDRSKYLKEIGDDVIVAAWPEARLGFEIDGAPEGLA